MTVPAVRGFLIFNVKRAAGNSEVTRSIGPNAFRAEVGTVDKASRTVDIVWTTGAKVRRSSWFGDDWDEELSLDPAHVRMDRLQSGSAPFLDSHRGYGNEGVIGVVKSAALEGGKGTAKIRFVSEGIDPNADQIFNKMADGILSNVSVGYRTHKAQKIEAEGKRTIIKAIDWEPHEISMVPIGADAGAAVVRAENSQERNTCILVERNTDTENIMKIDGSKAGNDSGTGGAAPAAVVADAGASRTVAIEVDSAAIVKGERERSAQIRKLGKQFRALPADFVERHAGEAGTSVAEFVQLASAEQERSDAKIAGGPNIESGEAEKDKFLRGAGDALILRSGQSAKVIEFAKREGREIKIDGREFRGMSMVAIAARCLEMAGVRTSGMDSMELVGKALTFRTSYNGTSDFAVLLENTMHKTLLPAYELAAVTWRRFCGVGSVSDFRPFPRYRRGTFGALQRVNEHGEFTNQQIPDGAKEVQQATTKGNIAAISRQAIINDDMGVFSQIGPDFGRAASMTVEKDVFALLAENGGMGPDMQDGNPLFDSTHGNIGSSSPLTVAGLDADRSQMKRQKDLSGNDFLGLMPAVLLVATELEGTGIVVIGAEFDNTAGVALQTPNRVRNMVRDIVGTPYLEGTTRYLFADPKSSPTIEVAFLNGQESPVLEVQNGWRVDGVEWKVRLDYGVAAVDSKTAIINDGEDDS